MNLSSEGGNTISLKNKQRDQAITYRVQGKKKHVCQCPTRRKNRNVWAVVGISVRPVDITRKDTSPDDQVLLWQYYVDSGT